MVCFYYMNTAYAATVCSANLRPYLPLVSLRHIIPVANIAYAGTLCGNRSLAFPSPPAGGSGRLGRFPRGVFHGMLRMRARGGKSPRFPDFRTTGGGSRCCASAASSPNGSVATFLQRRTGAQKRLCVIFVARLRRSPKTPHSRRPLYAI